MTRIITITSGMAGAGKTHLAINLALELVRRGRFAGVFHDAVQGGGIGGLLELQALPESPQDNEDQHGMSRQGYQGIDVLGCELPLDVWLHRDSPLRSQCIGDIEGVDGYDDFLVDTSSMDARSQVACCQAAAMVALVVTPQAASQAEAFALLRVLALNGFSGELFLIVNKSEYAVDSKELYKEFSELTKRYLALEVEYLGSVSDDRLVPLAELNRQAFSSLFPDSGATAGVVAVVDELDDATSPKAASQTLPLFLDKLLGAVQSPVLLPGGMQLEAVPPVAESIQQLAGAKREQSGNLSLLQYEGGVSGLWRFLELLPHALQSLGAELDALVSLQREQYGVDVQRHTVLALLAELLSGLGDADPPVSLDLDVSDTFVTGQQPCWLQPGRYLKYVVQLPPAPLPDDIRTLLLAVPGMVNSAGADGEEMYELLEPAHNRCLSVVASARSGAQIQVWLPVDGRDSLAGLQEGQSERLLGMPGTDLH